jgi:CheY-like chemotaxis protein
VPTRRGSLNGPPLPARSISAASGHERLKLLGRDNGIELVITDLNMPGMDGIEFFKAARKIDRYDDNGPMPAVPFILLTATRPSVSSTRRDINILQKALDVGFLEVMLKPIDDEHLI